MKKAIRLNEEDIRNLVTEVINEMSPEFMAHAARMADRKNRTVHGDRFRRNAVDKFNKDFQIYGIEHPGVQYYMNDKGRNGTYDRTANLPDENGRSVMQRSSDDDISKE